MANGIDWDRVRALNNGHWSAPANFPELERQRAEQRAEEIRAEIAVIDREIAERHRINTRAIVSDAVKCDRKQLVKAAQESGRELWSMGELLNLLTSDSEENEHG